jgi:hypothetical protein
MSRILIKGDAVLMTWAEGGGHGRSRRGVTSLLAFKLEIAPSRVIIISIAMMSSSVLYIDLSLGAYY